MATVSLAQAVGVNKAPVQTSNLKTVYKIWYEVDLAEAVTAKGSALATGDIIEAVRVPAGHLVLAAAAKKSAALTGTAADLLIDVGITGVDADAYVADWDFDAAAVGSYATPPAAAVPLVVSTSDTIDLLLAFTGTVTGGKIEVHAVVADLTHESRGAIAQPKS
ncbi:hypothetical protein SmphiM6_15 [Sinorhizobium phage phiM6]|nr:hypothetical protein SmphiM6_15 [Sinorhizobium phage phiM6]